MTQDFSSFKTSGQWSGNPIRTVGVDFTEQGAAGVYAVSIPIPANAIILDVRWANDVLWGAGSSATLNVGDDADTDRFIAALNVLTTPEVGSSINLASTGASLAEGFYPTGGHVLATLTTVGTASSQGVSHLFVSYSVVANRLANVKGL